MPSDSLLVIKLQSSPRSRRADFEFDSKRFDPKFLGRANPDTCSDALGKPSKSQDQRELQQDFASKSEREEVGAFNCCDFSACDVTFAGSRGATRVDVSFD